MKLSSALVVSMTTAASMAAAVENAPLLQKDIGSDAASALGDTSSLPMGIHHHPTASTHVRESLPRSDNMTAVVATSALLHNKEHTSGGGNKNVDVDVGLLPISERSLDSVQENCACTSRPKIKVSGTDFKDLIYNCVTGKGKCPKYLDYDNIPIGCWNTSAVTDMSSALDYSIQPTHTGFNTYQPSLSVFNKPINCWNTARVTNMNKMFYRSEQFNQSLNDWNVASVKDMDGMFSQVYSNQSLNDWNVAGVTTMKSMFFQANFNQPIDDWNVASVNDMNQMFEMATYFNQPLDKWNVASVTDMYSMFAHASKFNQCLSTWADKTPPSVNVTGIFTTLFTTSGCPDKVAVANVGPWCQGKEDNCVAPQPTGGTSSLTNLLSASKKQKKTTKKNNKN